MRDAARLIAVAISIVLTAGCGSSPTPAARVSSATPSADASPTAVASPTSVAGACQPCLALVTLRGSDNVVVRDITDLLHPKTIGNVGPTQPQFVNATEVSYFDATGIVRAPLSGAPKSTVAKGSASFRWSPDGLTIAYLDRTTLHLVSGGEDHVAAGSFAGLPEVFGCESQTCGDSWDFVFTYSPDGRFISWAQNVTDVFRVWTSDGRDVTPEVASLPFMTVWSGSGLYFRDAKGVEVYRDGAVSTFLPGVAWMFPDASADGKIAYETRDAKGITHVFVVDAHTAKVRELASLRSRPIFLSSRYVWYQGERLCTAQESGLCTTTFSEKTYIYDLQTGVEYDSIITQVYDVWPHAA
jgi:hypothetical protein